MVADALAPCVDRTSAPMILTVVQESSYLTSGRISTTWVVSVSVEEWYELQIYSMFPMKNLACKGLKQLSLHTLKCLYLCDWHSVSPKVFNKPGGQQLQHGINTVHCICLHIDDWDLTIPLSWKISNYQYFIKHKIKDISEVNNLLSERSTVFSSISGTD